jgi:hypothetical protein
VLCVGVCTVFYTTYQFCLDNHLQNKKCFETIWVVQDGADLVGRTVRQGTKRKYGTQPQRMLDLHGRTTVSMAGMTNNTHHWPNSENP